MLYGNGIVIIDRVLLSDNLTTLMLQFLRASTRKF